MLIKNRAVNYLLHLRVLFVFIGISGAFAVLFSAWLAHAGSALAYEEQRRLVIALTMQFIHTLVLLIILVWLKINIENQLVISLNEFLLLTAYIFLLGILCFSGALYLKTFHLLSFLGKLAPFGGISLAFGWLMLAASVSFRK
jgi:uncharacterized membrane protein YgdD (TMEM256/DUF423 family)